MVIEEENSYNSFFIESKLNNNNYIHMTTTEKENYKQYKQWQQQQQ